MQKNLRSIVLLLILLSIALFLAGFRLGKKVERIDKTYVPPTLPVSPTSMMKPSNIPQKFNSYLNPTCALAFLYPGNLAEEQLSSQEAQLTNSTDRIFISCDQNNIKQAKELSKDLEKTSAQTAKGQKLSLFQKDATTQSWIMFNTLTGKQLLFESSPNLTNLVLKTLEFVK